MTERVVGVVTVQGNDVSDLCNRLGAAHGCPPRVIVACAIAESRLDEHAERWGAWPDVSFGLCQQTVAYAPIGDHTGSVANISLVRAALFDVTTALEIAVPQLARFWQQYGDGPETLGRYNWPSRGLQGNPNRGNIESAWIASAEYVALEEEPTPMHYDPDTPDEYQVQDWTCSVRTATWLLRSLGFDVTAGDMQDRMVAAGLVTPADGLLVGTGGPLAAWLGAQSGLPAHALSPVSWDWLQAHAGTQPIGIGSGTLYHWLCVRKRNDDGTLQLMNPAPGYRGVGEVMDSATFERWAPWAAVYIEVPEEDELSAEDRATLDWWQGVAPVLPGFLNTVEDQATALAQRTRGQNHEAAAAILAQLASFRKVSGYKREELETD